MSLRLRYAAWRDAREENRRNAAVDSAIDYARAQRATLERQLDKAVTDATTVFGINAVTDHVHAHIVRNVLAVIDMSDLGEDYEGGALG